MNPASAQVQVNLDNYETQAAGEFPPIPAGIYPGKIDDAKLDETRDGGWPMYVYRFVIEDGEYRGRNFWHRRPVLLNVPGKKDTIGWIKGDAKVLGIGLGHASTLLDLAKVMVREALGRRCAIKIGFGKGEYADKNEIKALLSLDSLPTSDGSGNDSGPLRVDE